MLCRAAGLIVLGIAAAACGGAHTGGTVGRTASATLTPPRGASSAAGAKALAPVTIRVLGPLATGSCPTGALPLAPTSTNLARAAVLLAVATQDEGAGRTDLNTAGAVVTAYPRMPRTDRLYAIRRCGARVAARSLVVNATFPKIAFSAALSYETFYAARTPRGWDLWDLTPGGGG